MNRELTQKVIASLVLGLVALALDYFLLRHFVRTPVNMAGGLGVGVILLYLIVPFLILQFGGKRNG